LAQLHQCAPETLQPHPAVRIAWRNRIGTAKPHRRLLRLAKIQFVQPDLLIGEQLAWVAVDHGCGSGDRIRKPAARPEEKRARLQHASMIRSQGSGAREKNLSFVQ